MTTNNDQNKSSSQDSKYRELLRKSGYNADAPELMNILKKMHDNALSAALAARAFKVWQNEYKQMQTVKEETNE